MNIDTLVNEARALARPITYLIANGTGPGVGTWWGPESNERRGDARCWLVLDCGALPALGLSSGMLAVYEESDRAFAVVDAHFSANPSAKAQEFYAVEGQSLPPLDGVFRFGSEAIGAWLARLGWERDWAYNDNFPDSIAQEYDSVYRAQCPVYEDLAWATIGGWHFPWPDDDWEDRLADRLLVTTYHESEPWLEVWETSDQALQVYSRIS